MSKKLSSEDILDSVKVTVCGQYYSNVGRIKQVTAYEVEVDLPRKAIPFALQYIQSNLVNRALTKLDPTSLGFRTCAVVSQLPQVSGNVLEEELGVEIESDFSDVVDIVDEFSALDDMGLGSSRSRGRVRVK